VKYCTVHSDVHDSGLTIHSLLIVSSACRLCSPDNKRLRRRLDDYNTTQELADLLAEAQDKQLKDSFISQEDSCLFNNWDSVVHINITHISNQTKRD
jgi:hypothetical protein